MEREKRRRWNARARARHEGRWKNALTIDHRPALLFPSPLFLPYLESILFSPSSRSLDLDFCAGLLSFLHLVPPVRLPPDCSSRVSHRRAEESARGRRTTRICVSLGQLSRRISLDLVQSIERRRVLQRSRPRSRVSRYAYSNFRGILPSGPGGSRQEGRIT